MGIIIHKNKNIQENVRIRQDVKNIDLIYGTTPEQKDADVGSYEYSGYHRNSIAGYLKGQGGGSSYSRQYDASGNLVSCGLSIYNRMVQQEEMLITSTGEPVWLLRRKWTGELCPCWDKNRQRADARCPVCVPPGTLILTGNYEYKPVEDIQVGEKLLTHAGNFEPVTEILQRDIKEDLYHIKVWGNTVLNWQTTHNHPIFTLRVPRASNGSVDWRGITSADMKFINADSLKVSDYLCLPISREPNSDINLQQAKLLGYYVAEGCVLFTTKNLREISFGFKKDEHYINEVQDLSQLLFQTTRGSLSHVGTSKGVDLRFSSAKMAQFFLEHISSNNAKNNLHKRLSSDLMNMSRESALSFIGAWINGDGSIARTKKSVSVKIDTSNITLARQLHYLALKNRLHCSIGRRTNNMGPQRREEKTVIYYVEFYGPSIEALKPYSDKIKDLMPRKVNKDRIKFYHDWVLFPIKSIERIPYEGKVYNFEVMNDHSYTIEGLGLHNCFGVGYVGGYVGFVNKREPEGRIFIRVSPNTEDLKSTEQGLTQANEIQAWTLPIPTLRDRDVIVRFDPYTKQESWRYLVTEVTRNSGLFNMFTAQTFNITRLDKTHPINFIRVVDLLNNQVGDLQGKGDELQDKIEAEHGDGFQDGGFSFGYFAGFDFGYHDAFYQKPYRSIPDDDQDGWIDEPFWQARLTSDKTKEFWLVGYRNGYKDGFDDGDAQRLKVNPPDRLPEYEIRRVDTPNNLAGHPNERVVPPVQVHPNPDDYRRTDIDGSVSQGANTEGQPGTNVPCRGCPNCDK